LLGDGECKASTDRAASNRPCLQHRDAVIAQGKNGWTAPGWQRTGQQTMRFSRAIQHSSSPAIPPANRESRYMRADVLQAVALCCHSCAFLARESERTPEILATSPFASVHEIRFERAATGKLAPGIIADSIPPWLRKLSKEGVERFGLSLAGCPWNPFDAPSEPWGILSDGDVGVEVWQPIWKRRIRTYSDPAPWQVTYSASRAGRWTVHSPYGLADVDKLLKCAIVQTSSVHHLISQLLNEDPSAVSDIFPADWPAHQRAVGELGARTAALMRSEDWARVLFKGELTPTHHDSVSRKLWSAALMALEASAKAEEPALEHPTGRTLHLAG